MMHLRHGIFDEASISVIAADTIREIGRLAGRDLDVRRFRPNILVRLLRPDSFQEDKWLGGVLLFGKPGEGPCVSVTMVMLVVRWSSLIQIRDGPIRRCLVDCS